MPTAFKIQRICIIWIAVLATTAAAQSTQSSASPAAMALIARVLPQHANQFFCETIPQVDGKDVFEIEAKGDKILLRGNDGLSQAMAFNWYLRYCAHTSYDWQATGPIKLPEPLPVSTSKIHHICQAQERFFLNYTTYGYTFPFTDWEGWQRFIDWMAMNGINRPLLQCGQEATWYRVWKSYGLDDMQIRSYFSGPAYLPWHRMTNIDKWDGPLPVSYMDGQAKLQIKILERTRSLGMKPILSGFAGHVPAALKTVMPNASITRIPSDWGGFGSEYGTWFLASTDPLFKDVQLRFLKEQAAMYGTDHLYAADPFNEISPPSWEPGYLTGVSKSIYDGLAAGDPEAIWYQMAWTFGVGSKWLKPSATGGEAPFDALCKGVPTGKMVFLDYVCEEHELYLITKDFNQAPFIWSYVGNYGGCTYMLAPVEKISDRIAKSLAVSNCRGVGCTLEGVNTNPIAYELTLEQPWHEDGKVDYEEWCADYATRRCARIDPAVSAAWKILTDKVFINRPVSHFDRGSAVVEQPSLNEKLAAAPKTALVGRVSARSPEIIAALSEAATELLKASSQAQAADSYRYDAVNIVRQLMAYQSDDAKGAMMAAYKRHDLAAFRTASARLLDIIRDMDTLVGTRHEYLLGSWIRDARAWGANPVEADYYERDSRQILTTWGAPGDRLTDYARREWAGLLSTYYFPRWDEFIKRLDASLVNDQPFDGKAYAQWRTDFERDWVNSTKEHFATEPHGDPVEIARQMLEKYRS